MHGRDLDTRFALLDLRGQTPPTAMAPPLGPRPPPPLLTVVVSKSASPLKVMGEH